MASYSVCVVAPSVPASTGERNTKYCKGQRLELSHTHMDGRLFFFFFFFAPFSV